MEQVTIVGGGIIGLSIAYELATRDFKVTIVDKHSFGKKASWAGAGMLPPAESSTAVHPYEHLAAVSNLLHADWSADLSNLTGINNDYRASGSLHLAASFGEIASLTGLKSDWTELEIPSHLLDANELKAQFPFLDTRWQNQNACRLFTRLAAQFDNQKQIEALYTALERLNAKCLSNVRPVSFHHRPSGHSKVVESVVIETESGDHQSLNTDVLILAAGPWTFELTESLGVELPMQPVRGQMVGYQLDPESNHWVTTAPTINEGSRYLVARSSGSVIAGSTIEETGFDCQTTDKEIQELRGWAESIIPKLDDSTFQTGWAGLRPATFDGFPYIGPLQGFSNVLVAAGHFKSGLQLSTGTAKVIGDLIEHQTSDIDVTPFAPSRVER